MTNPIYKMIDKIKQKWVKPKVYTLVLKVRGFQHLSLQAAYSLEEAFARAKESLTKEAIPGITKDDINLSKIDMYHFIEADILFKDYFEDVEDLTKTVEIKDSNLTAADKKNILMKRITDTKDLKLFEENKSLFSEAEVIYLTNKIFKK